MLFNSWIFIGFFALFYPLFLLVHKKLHWRNGLLVIASYIFYGYWDWRFLSLIIFSTILDFIVSHRMVRHGKDASGKRYKKRLLTISVAANLGLLGFFKYFNFFADSLVVAFASFGITLDPVTLHILLPVGISFYTFQTMSYTIEVYRGQLAPCKNIVDFALYVSFFPQLVAGPIERATHLLPQVQRCNPITEERVDAGLFLLLSGFFKKIVVADNMAPLVNAVFEQPEAFRGGDVWIALLAFAFQIYGDFSGYSDIARGVAKFMGFDLMVNFNLPYAAINPQEFWKRWHISLSQWLRDYLYIPLGGNRMGPWATRRNLMITMVLGGFWHGAAWNFVLWGMYQGVLLVVYREVELAFRARPLPGRLGRVFRPVQWGTFFGMVLYGWLLFRATSLHQIFQLSAKLGSWGSLLDQGLIIQAVACLIPLLILELFQYRSRDLLFLLRSPLFVRSGAYAALMIWIMVFGSRVSSEFIYFQF